MKELTLFAKRLKKAREQRGMKQKELAEKIDVTPQTISAYEKADVEGKGKNPTLENAISAAKVLGVSLDWLCGIDLAHDDKDLYGTSYGEIIRKLVDASEKAENASLSSITLTERVFIDYGGDYPRCDNVDISYPVIVFKDDKIKSFMESWIKIKSIRDSNTIDEELYRLWMDKHLAELDHVKVHDAVEIDDEEDGELPF